MCQQNRLMLLLSLYNGEINKYFRCFNMYAIGMHTRVMQLNDYSISISSPFSAHFTALCLHTQDRHTQPYTREVFCRCIFVFVAKRPNSISKLFRANGFSRISCIRLIYQILNRKLVRFICSA